MITLLIIAAYVACIFGFIAWDAFVGLPFDFDGYERPPLGLVAIFWPIAFPICFFTSVVRRFDKVKAKRLAKEDRQTRLRVAAEQEIEQHMEEVEEEIRNTSPWARK